MGQKISLVLSGGGARGIAHIGVIEELEKQGFEIHSIVGTSMGALIGGVYALGKIKELKDWFYTLDRVKIFGLVDFKFSAKGLIKGERVLNTMKEFTSDSNIEDLPIRYAAVAADLLNTEQVVFRKGKVYDAIRASIAIPTVLTPVKVGTKQLLVDGGVLNNLPTKHADRIDGDLLIAVNVNANIPIDKPDIPKEEQEKQEAVYRTKLKEFYNYFRKLNISGDEKDKDKSQDKEDLGFFDLLHKTITMMTNRIAEFELERYQPDVLIETSVDAAGTFDFYRAEELVEMGRYAAQKTLQKLKDDGKL